MTTNYKKRFAAAKAAAQPRNDAYEPYKLNPESRNWYFDDVNQHRHGPCLSEELCISAARRRQERDEDD